MLNKVVKAILVFSLSFLAAHTAYAKEEAPGPVAPPKFSCTLTDELTDDSVGAAKDTFKKETPMIYYVCVSDEVKKDQDFKAVWIATDTHNAAPANYKIDEKGLVVTQDIKSGEQWTAKYSISRPTNGWPVGEYRVELVMGDRILETAKFHVK